MPGWKVWGLRQTCPVHSSDPLAHSSTHLVHSARALAKKLSALGSWMLTLVQCTHTKIYNTDKLHQVVLGWCSAHAIKFAIAEYLMAMAFSVVGKICSMLLLKIHGPGQMAPVRNQVENSCLYIIIQKYFAHILQAIPRWDQIKNFHFSFQQKASDACKYVHAQLPCMQREAALTHSLRVILLNYY